LLRHVSVRPSGRRGTTGETYGEIQEYMLKGTGIRVGVGGYGMGEGRRHTILPVLDASQALQPCAVDRSERLAGEGCHDGEWRTDVAVKTKVTTRCWKLHARPDCSPRATNNCAVVFVNGTMCARRDSLRFLRLPTKRVETRERAGGGVPCLGEGEGEGARYSYRAGGLVKRPAGQDGLVLSRQLWGGRMALDTSWRGGTGVVWDCGRQCALLRQD
jgi:hypothetical protein